MLEFREFEATFNTYVRIDEESGDLVDSRLKLSEDVGLLNIETVIDLLNAYDLAAMLSKSVRVVHPEVMAGIRAAKPRLLRKALAALELKNQLPLQPENGTARHLLTEMTQSDEGCLYYREVAEYLAWGLEQPGLRVHMCGFVPSVRSLAEETILSEDLEDYETHDEDEEQSELVGE